jgi:hypothetical protein
VTKWSEAGSKLLALEDINFSLCKAKICMRSLSFFSPVCLRSWTDMPGKVDRPKKILPHHTIDIKDAIRHKFIGLTSIESIFTAQVYVKFNVIYEGEQAHLWFSLPALSDDAACRWN